MSVLSMGPTIRRAQLSIGYNFKNTQYLWEALQAPGSVVRSGSVEGVGTEYHSVGFRRFPDGNRRLAILGDTVLKLALVENWYRGGEVRERSSRIVSDVGSNNNLDRIGRTNGLDALINKNPASKENDASPITVATTVEAILGAVYLDSNMSSVAQVMQSLGLIPRFLRKIAEKVPVSENATSSTSTSERQDGQDVDPVT